MVANKMCSVYFFVIILGVNVCVFCEMLPLEEYNNLVSYTNCRIDEDCTKISNNTFCFDNDADKIGKCKCRDGYDLISRNTTFFACLGPAGYGERCEKNMQCQLILTENSECHSGSCRCKDGSHRFTDGRCYVSVLLGDLCRSDGNCWMTGDKFGNCVYGKCTCKFDREVPTEEKTSCIPGRNLGELCNNDAECAVTPNTQCRVNCRCSPEFVLSRNQNKCLRAATQFFEPCEENDQCSAYLTGSICPSNNCTCPEGFHGYGSRCVKSIPLGGCCDNIEECIPDKKYSDIVNCIDRTCQCVKGAVNQMLGCNSGELLRVNFGLVFLISFVFFRIL